MTTVVIERNVYCGTTQPQATVTTSYSKTTNEGIWPKTVENEDGTTSTLWYIAQSTKEIYDETLSKVTADQDVLIVESLEGTISDTSKARLYARLVHDSKKTWPTDIPSELRTSTYDAYTNHYKFTPAINPPANILSQAFTITGGVCDTTMYLTSIDELTTSGTVTVTSGENKTYVDYTAISGNTLTGCTCSSAEDVTYPIGSEVNQA